jgi:hypothetical protein
LRIATPGFLGRTICMLVVVLPLGGSAYCWLASTTTTSTLLLLHRYRYCCIDTMCIFDAILLVLIDCFRHRRHHRHHRHHHYQSPSSLSSPLSSSSLFTLIAERQTSMERGLLALFDDYCLPTQVSLREYVMPARFGRPMYASNTRTQDPHTCPLKVNWCPGCRTQESVPSLPKN